MLRRRMGSRHPLRASAWASNSRHFTSGDAIDVRSRVALTATQRALIEQSDGGHVSVIGGFASGKTTVAAERVLWLDTQRDRRVLALSGTRNASLVRRLDCATTFHALERRGHRVAGVREWTQQTLEELGVRTDGQRVLSFGQLTSFLMHHASALPLRAFHQRLAAASSLQLRRSVADMVRFFTMLEAHGVQPDVYTAYATTVEDESHVELALAYGVYRQLLQRHDVRSWDGLVLDLHQVFASDPHCLDAATHEFSDIVIDDFDRMTPAMVAMVARVLQQPHLESSLSCSHSDNHPCPRTSQLHALLDSLKPAMVQLPTEGETSFSLFRDRVGVRRVAAQVLSSGSGISSNTSRPVVTSLEFNSSEDEARSITALIQQRLSSAPSPRITVFCPSKADVTSITQVFLANGIRVNGRGSIDPTRRLLFDEPGVDSLFSLLVALWSATDTKHMYNVLRSEFLGFPAVVLSRLMATQHRQASHATLADVLADFVDTKGSHLRAIDDVTLTTALESAQLFLTTMNECREQCHSTPVAEIVQFFLDRTGHLERLVDPQTPRDARHAIALAAFLKEIETAQRIVQSKYVPIVVPYLVQLQSARVVSIDDDGEENDTSLHDSSVRVLPLTRYDLDDHQATLDDCEDGNSNSNLVVLMGMRDAKFPGRLKRITWPLPTALLAEPLPIQTRTAFLADAERLVYDALVQLNPSEIVVSYAKTIGGGSVKRPEKLSRVLEPLWTPPVVLPFSSGDSPPPTALPPPSAPPPPPPLPAHSFEPTHLSYSQIAEYVRCPQQYYLSRVLGLRSFADSEDEAPNLAMMFGSAVHAAVAAFSVAVQRGDTTEVAEHEAFRVLDHAWRRDGFLSTRQQDFFRARAESSLRGFLNRHDPTAKVVAIEQSFECQLGHNSDVPLRGVWDRVDRTRDGAILIREFKTNPSAQRRPNQDAAAAESLQLQLYMVAYEQLYGETPRGATLEVLEEEDASNAVGFVPYAKELRGRVDAVVDATMERIRRSEFDATPGYLQCAMCPYASSACRANVAVVEDASVV